LGRVNGGDEGGVGSGAVGAQFGPLRSLGRVNGGDEGGWVRAWSAPSSSGVRWPGRVNSSDEGGWVGRDRRPARPALPLTRPGPRGCAVFRL